MQVGKLEIDSIIDGVGHFVPTFAFAGTSDEQWNRHRDLLNPDGTVSLAYGSFLIRGIGDRIILVDVGVGDTIKWGDAFFEAGHLLSNLHRSGVEPGDVTDVLFTHLHYDHVGWATRKGKVTFPNATYRCHRRDWEHFVGPDPGATRKLSPLTGQLETWEADTKLFPGLDAIAAPGHTPGSTVIVVSSDTERAVLLGDVVHCPVQLLDPEWSAIADVDPPLARRTRISLARELEGSDAPLAASHFPGLSFGRLLGATGTRRWVF